MKKISILAFLYLFGIYNLFALDYLKKPPVRVNELIHSESRQYLSLSGTWQFQLDPEKTGEKEKWYLPGKTFDLSKKDPATRYFFGQVLWHMTGDAFDPKATISLDFLQKQLKHDAVFREHMVEFKKDSVMPNLKRTDEK